MQLNNHPGPSTLPLQPLTHSESSSSPLIPQSRATQLLRATPVVVQPPFSFRSVPTLSICDSVSEFLFLFLNKLTFTKLSPFRPQSPLRLQQQHLEIIKGRQKSRGKKPILTRGHSRSLTAGMVQTELGPLPAPRYKDEPVDDHVSSTVTSPFTFSFMSVTLSCSRTITASLPPCQCGCNSVGLQAHTAGSCLSGFYFHSSSVSQSYGIS